MSAICAICHKKSMRGNLVSHSKQRTHRLYRVNLHTIKTIIDGVHKTIKACTKCLRRLKDKAPRSGVSLREKTSVTPVTSVTQLKEEKGPKEVKVKTTTIAELMKEPSFAKALEGKSAGVIEEKKEVKKKAEKGESKTKPKKAKKK